eukprot:171930-Hanusia_phi.AAC.1
MRQDLLTAYSVAKKRELQVAAARVAEQEERRRRMLQEIQQKSQIDVQYLEDAVKEKERAMGEIAAAVASLQKTAEEVSSSLVAEAQALLLVCEENKNKANADLEEIKAKIKAEKVEMKESTKDFLSKAKQEADDL